MTLSLPPIGFGTVHLDGAPGVEAIATAIDAGYRLIDTAYNYENEGTVGKAVRESGVPREELIVTSKLPGRFHARDLGRVRIEESLYRLNLDYIDLLLIHWPNPSKDLYVEAWETLIEVRDAGLVKHIGVSNFLPNHIDRLRRETGELPAVNQIELHPYFPQVEQVDFHDELGIITEAWSPLSNGRGLVERAIAQGNRRALRGRQRRNRPRLASRQGNRSDSTLHQPGQAAQQLGGGKDFAYRRRRPGDYRFGAQKRPDQRSRSSRL